MYNDIGDTMQILIKTFQELTNEELYEIIKLRVDVFILEQECFYDELDDRDQNAIHIFIKEDSIESYCRVFPPGDHFKETQIGRVVTKTRGKGYGKAVMGAAINYLSSHYPNDSIRIEAQTYAEAFYNKLGFYKVSDPFLEDGILHIEMLRGKGRCKNES